MGTTVYTNDAQRVSLYFLCRRRRRMGVRFRRSHDERRQNVAASRLIPESNQPHDGIEKIHVQMHVHRLRARIPFSILTSASIRTVPTGEGSRSASGWIQRFTLRSSNVLAAARWGRRIASVKRVHSRWRRCAKQMCNNRKSPPSSLTGEPSVRHALRYLRGKTIEVCTVRITQQNYSYLLLQEMKEHTLRAHDSTRPFNHRSFFPVYA
jgi:hypothetical protein